MIRNHLTKGFHLRYVVTFQTDAEKSPFWAERGLTPFYERDVEGQKGFRQNKYERVSYLKNTPSKDTKHEEAKNFC